ncbi:hypothetical protein JQ633_07530 [Bradyrhizobium tropiciagri]|uniref:hypothetical protein n=1 Tax=Bradyrhizobium tropiciagri TaxID=312253 RepID=UPI001BA631A1|nr:hypothetical protein [Bradyrhizobium tropiciagri]MBR0870202.1 hypothetical protein [Bradyrhizobium tropiciagri]
MTNAKILSAAMIAVAMIATPALARENHAVSRHVAETNAAMPADPVYVDGYACVPAPRVGAFATAPWTGDNVPCEPGTF